MIRLRESILYTAVFGFIAMSGAFHVKAEDPSSGLLGQLNDGVWTLQVNLTEDEYAALEPVAPPMTFGGPTPPTQQQTHEVKRRDTVANLFGMQFPWVHGSLDLLSEGKKKSGIPCRIRYDGDFTYLLAAQSPNRPMFIELLDGHDIQGVTSFRLHTMQFDPTMLRERIASHIFASLDVTVTRTAHAGLRWKVGDRKPEFVGLYTILEAVDNAFLRRNALPQSSLLSHTDGLSTIRYVGDRWEAYAQVFRVTKLANDRQQNRMIEFAKLIDESTDQEFDQRIDDFIDVEKLLRYLAASSLTSNITGMSTIGANDLLCLDAEGRIHIVATQFDTALGGSILSGLPDELTNLRVMQTYAGQCRLFDRLLANETTRDRYLQIVRQSVNEFFAPERMKPLILVLTETTATSRERETKATAERMRKLMQAFGGGGGPVPPPVVGGFGPPPMDVMTFVAKRNDSIRKQLDGSEPGFIPRLPNLGGFAGGGQPQKSTAPITETEFRESVKVPDEFNATLFARAPSVNYPVAIAAEPSGAIYVASDEQGSLGTDKGGGKILRCVDDDADGVMDNVVYKRLGS